MKVPPTIITCNYNGSPPLPIYRIVNWTVFRANFQGMSAPRKSGGSYWERCSEDIMQIVPADFVNPWNFSNFSLRMTMMFTNGVNEMDFHWPVDNSRVMTLNTYFHCPVDNWSHYRALLEAWYLDELTAGLLELTPFFTEAPPAQETIWNSRNG